MEALTEFGGLVSGGITGGFTLVLVPHVFSRCCLCWPNAQYHFLFICRTRVPDYSITLSYLYILRWVQQTLWHSIGKGDYGICNERQQLWIWPTKMRIRARFAVPHLFLLRLVSYNYLFACPHNIIFHLNTVILMLQIFFVK